MLIKDTSTQGHAWPARQFNCLWKAFRIPRSAQMATLAVDVVADNQVDVLRLRHLLLSSDNASHDALCRFNEVAIAPTNKSIRMGAWAISLAHVSADAQGFETRRGGHCDYIAKNGET